MVFQPHLVHVYEVKYFTISIEHTQSKINCSSMYYAHEGSVVEEHKCLTIPHTQAHKYQLRVRTVIMID